MTRMFQTHAAVSVLSLLFRGLYVKTDDASLAEIVHCINL